VSSRAPSERLIHDLRTAARRQRAVTDLLEQQQSMNNDSRIVNRTSGSKATRREWIGLAVLALPCPLYSMDLTVLNLEAVEEKCAIALLKCRYRT